jgi:hypothetical protein
MATALRDAELTCIKALHQATDRRFVTWMIVPNDNRDIFQALVDGEPVMVEFISFAVAAEGAYERVLARVTGLKTEIQVAVGTEAYDLIASMLSLNIRAGTKG